MTNGTKTFLNDLAKGNITANVGDILMKLFDTDDIDYAMSCFGCNDDDQLSDWADSYFGFGNDRTEDMYEIVEECIDRQITNFRIRQRKNKYLCNMSFKDYDNTVYDVEFIWY